MKQVPISKDTLLRSEFIRNTSKLVSGTTIAQLIPILIQPILRRYYSAEIFGTYAVYLSIIGILYGIASLRYEQAIISPEDKNEACSIFTVAQLFNIIFSVLLFIVILLFKNSILSFFNISEEYSVYLFIAPAGIFLFNLQQSINLWLIRNKAFGGVSKIKIVRRSSEGLFQLLFRYLRFSGGLLLGDILGHISNIIYGSIQIFKKGFTLKGIRWKNLKDTISKYSEYPKYNAITSFLNAFSMLVPVILINKYYGAENAGLFDLSRLLLLTPAALMAGAFSNIMLQRVAEKSKKKHFFINEIFFLLAIGGIISIVEFVVLFFFGEQLFSIIFGGSWTFSGTISKILIWPYIVYFFTISLSSTFIALQRIKVLSLFQLVNFILVISLLFFTKLDFMDFIKAFAVLSIGGSLFFFFLLFSVIREYNRKKSFKSV